jgi:hypothetical protein
MLLVVNAPSIPASVIGTGTAAQKFAANINMPGSSRQDGAAFNLVVGGSILPAVNSNAQLQVWATYPTINGSPQYPNANITSAAMVNNVATYNGSNNFLAGQYVTVANIANTSLNGTVGPLLTANATAFTASNVNGAILAIANIANAAQTSSAAIAPVPFYTAVASPTLLLNTSVPFAARLQCQGDAASGFLTATGQDFTLNVNSAANGTAAVVPNLSTGTVVPVPGVNFKNEPPLVFTVSEAFGVSNANNAATLKQFGLES